MSEILVPFVLPPGYPTPESLIGLKSQDAEALVTTAGGTYLVYSRFQNPTDVGPGFVARRMEDVNLTRYNVALDRGNIVVDCNLG